MRRRDLLASLGGTAVSLGLAACFQQEERPTRGMPFPAFTLQDPAGKFYDSSHWEGMPRLINIWATWCPPCRAEMADLVSIHRKLSPRGLKLIAISVDTDLNLVREYLLQERLDLPVLIDPNQYWARTALKVPGFPTSYMIDRQNRIAEIWLGPRRWTDPQVEAEVVRLTGLG